MLYSKCWLSCSKYVNYQMEVTFQHRTWKLGDAHFPSTTRCHLELLMHRCNITCSRQKCLINSKVFHCRKAEISIYISNWIQWEIGTYQSVVEYIYWWIPGNHQLVQWQEGWCLQKKRKELIRHVKQYQKTWICSIIPWEGRDEHHHSHENKQLLLYWHH